MVSISDEYKYKRLVKTTFKFVWEAYLARNLPHAQLKCRLHYSSKKPIFSPVQPVSPTSIDRMGYYLGPLVEILLNKRFVNSGLHLVTRLRL